MALQEQKQYRPVFGYAAVTLFCLVFGLVYEYFGFGVTSPFMHFAFLVPLLLGLLPRIAVLLFRKDNPEPLSAMGCVFWRMGIATLVTGSFFRGALDIYGTQSPLTVVYLIAGAVCLVAGVVLQKLFPA